MKLHVNTISWSKLSWCKYLSMWKLNRKWGQWNALVHWYQACKLTIDTANIVFYNKTVFPLNHRKLWMLSLSVVVQGSSLHANSFKKNKKNNNAFVAHSLQKKHTLSVSNGSHHNRMPIDGNCCFSGPCNVWGHYYYKKHWTPKVSALLLLNLVFKACFWCANIIGEASALFRWVFVFLANAIERECWCSWLFFIFYFSPPPEYLKVSCAVCLK